MLHVGEEAGPQQAAHADEGHPVPRRDQAEVDHGHRRPDGSTHLVGGPQLVLHFCKRFMERLGLHHAHKKVETAHC